MDAQYDISLFGASGLVGRTYLNQLARKGDRAGSVALAVRRPIEDTDYPPNLFDQVQVDFDRLDQYPEIFSAKAVVCCLGTTQRKAGSRAAFKKVDFDLPVNIGRLAKEHGAGKMVVISAVGANPKSLAFYSRVKGEMEKELKSIGLDELHILRPSLLLGKREESRPLEDVGQLLAAPAALMMPPSYRPISAEQLAKTIDRLVQQSSPGVHIHQGKALFA